MKKFLILLPAFLLIGCSNAKGVSFKDLKFDKPLNAEQLEEFDKNFTEASKTVKTLKLSSLSEEKHGFVERTTDGEGTYTMYTNGYKYEGSGKIDSKDNGVSYSTKETGTENAWVIKKDGASKIVTVTTTSESKETDIEVENYEEEALGLAFFAVTVGLDENDLDEVVIYQKGKEYAAVFSQETKQVTDKSEVMGQKKDLIQITNEQLVIEIGKDYKVKSASYFFNRSTNRDPDTNEWYSKAKPTKTLKTTMKVSYGSQETRNESELFDILKKEDKEFLVGIKPLLKMGSWNGNLPTPLASTFTGNAELTEVQINENQMMGTAQYQARFSLSSTINAFLRTLNAEVTYLTKDGFKTKTTELAGNISNYSYTLTQNATSDTSPVQFLYELNPSNEVYRLSFSLNLGETISFNGNPSVQEIN